MRKRTRRALISLASAAFTLAAVGLVLRFVPKLERGGSGLADYGETYRFDATREGGHLLPNLDMWMRGSAQNSKVRIVTNSKGFRNREEFSYAVPDGTFRILMLGDSFIDGIRTDQDETIGAVLEGYLKSHGSRSRYSDFEVMISGHNNPCDAWFYFQEHGRKYAPQLVIVGVTLGNDLTWQGYRRWMIPVPTVDGSVRLRFDGKSMDLVPKNLGVLLPPGAFDPPSSWDAWTDTEMRLRRFLADRFGFAGYSIPQPTNPWSSSRRQVHAADFTLSLGIFHQPRMPEAEEWFQDLQDVLAGLKHEIAASGAQLLVLIFPVRIQVNREEWELTRRAYGLMESAFDLDYPDRRIVAHCRQLDIPCLDLIETYRAHVRTHGDPLFRPRGDMHLNEAGQRLSAVTVGERLLESNLR